MFKKIVLLLTAAILALPLMAEKVTLAKDSKPQATIVLPEQPHAKLVAAANDLQSYVKQICGVTLPIVRTDKKVDGCGIYIWHNELSTAEDKLSSAHDPDTIVKTVRNGNIFLNGYTITAASWAVYTMLQEDLGVRWFAPGKDWEYVPKAPQAGTLVIDVKSKTFKPTISPRTWPGHFNTPELRKWCTRQRVMVNEIRNKAAFANNIFRIFPPEKYAKTHPEYYPLINGERYIPKANETKWRPCESNPEVQKVVVEYIRNYFDKAPLTNSFSLGLDDVFHLCQCDNCKAMDSSPDDMKNVSYSSRHYKFINIIAKEVAKTHPDRFVGTLIYNPTLQPPVDVPKMEDNVCAYITQDASLWKDPAQRKKAMDLTAEWAKRVKYLSRYEYIGLSCVTPRYYPHLLDEALRFDLKHNFIGMYQEVCTVLPIHAPMVWALAELEWDASRSMDSLLDEFMTRMYGESAAEMKDFFNFLEKCWMNNKLATWVFNDLKAQAVVMTVEELRAAHKILERAMAKATDPMTRKRIQTTDDGLRYGGFVIEEFNICKNYINHKVSGKADAVKIANDAVAFAKLAGEREKFWAKSMKEDSPLGESLRGLSARQNLCTGQISKIEHDLLSVVVDAMEYLRKNDPAEFAGKVKALEALKGSNFVQTLLAALAPGEAKSANLLINGNFEKLDKKGVPIGWTTWGYMPATFQAELKGGRNGSHAGRHNRNVGVSYMHYRNVKAGEVYYGEVWYKGSGKGNATLSFRFLTDKGWYPHTDLEPRVSAPATGEWQLLRVSCIVPPGAKRMQFSVSGNQIPVGHYVLVDDAVLQKMLSAEDLKKKEAFRNAPAVEEKNAIAVPAGSNVLRNGGFEAKSADGVRAPGWYTSGAPNGGLHKIVSNMGRNNSAAAMTYSVYGSVIQCFRVKPGEKYYAEAYFRGSAPAKAVMQIRYKKGGAWFTDRSKEFEKVQPVTWQWQRIQAVVTVPEGATEVHLMLCGRNIQPGEYMLFDDAVMKKIK